MAMPKKCPESLLSLPFSAIPSLPFPYLLSFILLISLTLLSPPPHSPLLSLLSIPPLPSTPSCPGYKHILLISNKLYLQSITHFPKINLGVTAHSLPHEIE